MDRFAYRCGVCMLAYVCMTVPRTVHSSYSSALLCIAVPRNNTHRWDSNPRGKSRMDFESVSFTARTLCPGMLICASNYNAVARSCS